MLNSHYAPELRRGRWAASRSGNGALGLRLALLLGCSATHPSQKAQTRALARGRSLASLRMCKHTVRSAHAHTRAPTPLKPKGGCACTQGCAGPAPLTSCPPRPPVGWLQGAICPVCLHLHLHLSPRPTFSSTGDCAQGLSTELHPQP